MANIFMAVTRVPWHCEHKVDKEKCTICQTHPKQSQDKGPRT